MAHVERILGKQDRIAGDLEVALQQVLGDRGGGGAGRGVGHEVVRIELCLVVAGRDGVGGRGPKVIRSVLEGVAQDAVARVGPVERAGAGNAPVDPVALVGDVDGGARVDEAPVLGAAAEEVLAIVSHERLGGRRIADVQRGPLLHDNLAVALDGHLGACLVELDRGRARRYDDLAIGLGDARLGMPVDVGGVRLGLDLRDMLRLARGGVLGKLARRVDAVAKDAVIQEGDATADAIVEGDVDDVAAGRVERRRLNRLERAGVGGGQGRCGGGEGQRRHKDERGDDKRALERRSPAARSEEVEFAECHMTCLLPCSPSPAFVRGEGLPIRLYRLKRTVTPPTLFSAGRAEGTRRRDSGRRL